MPFMWMADEQAWLTVRNVLSVDRRAVADSRVRFNELLSGSVNRVHREVFEFPPLRNVGADRAVDSPHHDPSPAVG